MPEMVGVQYLKGGGVYYFLTPKERLALDSFCVVEGEHGVQMARVVRGSKHVEEDHLPQNIRPIVRAASARDHEQLNKNYKKERDAYRLCRQKVQEKDMLMKLVDVSYTLDGRKAIFYFTAENRVDFRELVKELAQALKMKIEMRQIGVRDEARRLGGVGCCGRTLCCASFLKDFASVSIRMAKEQNLSLNPTKVSGLCGRLMCCLAYEYEGSAGKGRKKKFENKSGKEGKSEKATEAHGNCGACANECKEAVVPDSPANASSQEAKPTSGPVEKQENQEKSNPTNTSGTQQDKPGQDKRRNNFRRNRGNQNNKNNNRRT
jgi:cell fate regulator YaaT (PSP1 superfamily)